MSEEKTVPEGLHAVEEMYKEQLAEANYIIDNLKAVIEESTKVLDAERERADKADAKVEQLVGDLKAAVADYNAEREKRVATEAFKNRAYTERDRLVCALSKIFPSHLERHPDSDASWENDWRWIVFVQTPEGQCSWHIHDSELAWFDHLKEVGGNSWDGHTTEEKYNRLYRLSSSKMEAERDAERRRTEVAKAEVSVLRGEDCEADGEGPCGVCIKCLRKQAEENKQMAFHAFVAGAKWWEFFKTGATMWFSDQELAHQEAEKKYPFVPHPRIVEARQDALEEAAAFLESFGSLMPINPGQTRNDFLMAFIEKQVEALRALAKAPAKEDR